MYLDRNPEGGNAEKRLRDFFDIEELDGTVLNPGNDQRLILVAADFRKEVTATVLWLIEHGVRVQCFRVQPYTLGDDLLLDLQQIIPTPEASDYMIGMAAKESEERKDESTQKRRQGLRHAFWSRTLDALRDRGELLPEVVDPVM